MTIKTKDEYVVGGGEFLNMISMVLGTWCNLDLTDADDRSKLEDAIAANFEAIAMPLDEHIDECLQSVADDAKR